LITSFYCHEGHGFIHVWLSYSLSSSLNECGAFASEGLLFIKATPKGNSAGRGKEIEEK